MGEVGINPQWAARQAALIGTPMMVPQDGVIQAVLLPDGKMAYSSSRDNIPGKGMEMGREAQTYLGQEGSVVGVSLQARHIKMSDGAIVFLIVLEQQEP